VTVNRKDLPAPKSDNYDMRVRETLMTYLGRTGDPLDRGITLRDLLDNGLAKLRSGRTITNASVGGSGLPILPPDITITGGGGAEYVPDLTPPPTPTGFSVSAAINNIFITHDDPTYTQGHGHLRTRVYGKVYQVGDPLPTFGDAAEITQFTGFVHAHPSNPSTQWRLWIKWQTVDNVLSVSPAGGTNGLAVGTSTIRGIDLGPLIVESANLATASVSAAKIAANAVDPTKFASGIEPITIVSSVPTVQGTTTIYNTADKKLYRWSGTAYVASVPAADVTGQLTNSQLADIAATKITGQVVAGQIADAAISTAKFASGIEPVSIVTSVPVTKSTNAIYNSTDGKLYRWNGTAYVASVSTGDLAGTISDAQIAGMAASKVTGTLSDSQLAAISAAKVTGQIVGTQITDGAISTAKLAAGSVTAATIAADTITASQIAAGAITSSELAAGAVIAGKITAGAIVAADIAAGTITGDRIAANTITAAKIAADTITAAEIAAGAIGASEIAAGAVITAKLAAGAVTANEIAANSISAGAIQAAAITTAKIAAGAVTAGEIAASAVTATQLAAGAVTTAKLAAGAVTANEIAANTITAGLIATGAITATKLSANAIAVGTAAIQNGAIINAMIADLTVDAAKIADGTIVTAKINDGAITNAKIGETIQSNNYAAGSAGWSINKSGGAEFSNAIVRGGIYASFGTIGGATHDSTSIYSNNYAFGSSGYYLSNSGSIYAQNLNSGQFTGYNWPSQYQKGGFHASKNGVLMGNPNTGMYFQYWANADNTGTAPYFSFGTANGKYLTIGETHISTNMDLNGATGTFSGTLTAAAINAVNTINVANNAIAAINFVQTNWLNGTYLDGSYNTAGADWLGFNYPSYADTNGSSARKTLHQATVLVSNPGPTTNVTCAFQVSFDSGNSWNQLDETSQTFAGGTSGQVTFTFTETNGYQGYVIFRTVWRNSYSSGYWTPIRIIYTVQGFWK
jgi:hypothetical protein